MRRAGVIGIVLAGGTSTRLGGGDKGLRTVAGVPILDRLLATMAKQCAAIVINANGDPARFSRYGLPVVEDGVPGLPGPLAGILAGLEWVARTHPHAPFAVTVPTDAPFIPADFVARLSAAHAGRPDTTIACACSGGRLHPVAALWPVALRHDLQVALREEGIRKVTMFLSRHRLVEAEWPITPYDPFYNANTPADLAAAEQIAAAIDAAAG